MDFEIGFVTEALPDPSDERIDRVTQQIPNLVVSSDGQLTVITVLVQGADALEAGLLAAQAIEAAGIRVARTSPDLVTRQDIADRVGVTRQAVGNWVRGERHDDRQFPAPVSGVAGGVWLWADVADWTRSHGLGEGDAVQYPSLSEHNRLDLLISTGVKAVTVSTIITAADLSFKGRSAHARAKADYQMSYALAS